MARFESIHDEINHYRRLAEDKGATEAERELAQKRIQTLMIRHSISESNLADDEKRDDDVYSITMHVPTKMHHAKFHMYLAVHISRALGLSSITSIKYNEEHVKCHFIEVFGAYDTLILAQELFLQVSNYMAVGWVDFRNSLPVSPRTAHINGYFIGFIQEAERHVRESYKEEVVKLVGEDKALELYDRSKEYEKKLNEKYPDVYTPRSRSRKVTAEAMSAGHESARNADYGSSSGRSMTGQLSISA